MIVVIMYCQNFVEDFTNNVIIKLEKQNEELEKLRYLASEVDHCSICYTSVINYQCDICKKLVCEKCIQNWIFCEENEDNFPFSFCSPSFLFVKFITKPLTQKDYTKLISASQRPRVTSQSQ